MKEVTNRRVRPSLSHYRLGHLSFFATRYPHASLSHHGVCRACTIPAKSRLTYGDEVPACTFISASTLNYLRFGAKSCFNILACLQCVYQSMQIMMRSQPLELRKSGVNLDEAPDPVTLCQLVPEPMSDRLYSTSVQRKSRPTAKHA